MHNVIYRYAWHGLQKKSHLIAFHKCQENLQCGAPVTKQQQRNASAGTRQEHCKKVTCFTGIAALPDLTFRSDDDDFNVSDEIMSRSSCSYGLWSGGIRGSFLWDPFSIKDASRKHRHYNKDVQLAQVNLSFSLSKHGQQLLSVLTIILRCPSLHFFFPLRAFTFRDTHLVAPCCMNESFCLYSQRNSQDKNLSISNLLFLTPEHSLMLRTTLWL